MARSSLALLAALGAVAVLPAAAAAAPAPTASATPSLSTVTAHANAARGAAARTATLTRRGDARGARRTLKASRRQAVAASREARTLAATAPTAPQTAQALAVAAAALAAATDRFAALVAQADGALQTQLVGAVGGSAAGQQALVTALTELVASLRGDAQALAAQVLAGLQAKAPGALDALGVAAGLDNLAPALQATLDKAFAAATAALQVGLTQLDVILPTLPADAQAQVTAALGTATKLLEGLGPVLGDITKTVSSLLDGLLAPRP